MSDWNTLIIDPIREMLIKIISFIPTLIGALIILVVGWLAAKLIKKIAGKILDVIRFDKISEKAGISDILIKGGIKPTASQMLCILTYWLVMIIVLVLAVNAIGLTAASQFLDIILAYIPKVIVALFVIVLGMFLGNFIAGIVRTAASNANMPKPELLGGISRWAIVIFSATISLKELGIAPLLVTSTFNIFFGAVCLALALAFGLGGKDIAAKYLEELRKKHFKD